MNAIKDHPGLYVAREPDNRLPLWDLTTAKRQPLARVERVWRGVVMDTYALEKVTGWTPELAPPPDSPLFRWRVLAGVVGVTRFRSPRSSCSQNRSSSPAKAGDPVRRGLSIQSLLSLGYWIVRSSAQFPGGR